MNEGGGISYKRKTTTIGKRRVVLMQSFRTVVFLMLWYNLKQVHAAVNSDCDISSAIDLPKTKMNFVLRALSGLYTFIAFTIACCLVPWLISTFIVVRICRHIFVRWLENKFKGLEFVKRTTVRTAVDTQRNQGIVTVLLTVNGPCQLHFIKNRIQADIVERQKNGVFVFPHLRNVLTSRWGNYAWVKGSEKQFRIDNHIVLSGSNFKGRPVSDANIQEYISDIIAKMLPPEIPPWQITLVPTQQDKTFLLIRIHHLYLSEDGLSLGELLLLRRDGDGAVFDAEPAGDLSVLAGVFKPPVAIPLVYERICESLSNRWNEILYNYDDPSVLENSPNLTGFFFLCVIAFASAYKEYYKRDESLLRLVQSEMTKRGLSKSCFVACLWKTLSLWNLIRLATVLLLRLPMIMLKFPVRAVKMFLDTPVYLYWLYLAHYVVQESIYLFKIFYTAPRVIFEEIFLPERPCNVHQLQTFSYCGRKVVSWSDPVSADVIKQVTRATGSTSAEVIMSALASSLRDYFETAGYAIPDSVMTMCHFTPQKELLARKGQMNSGMLCLPLPMETPRKGPIECLRALRASLYKARSSQVPLYLASLYQLDYSLFITVFPTLFAKAFLYLLSRRYTVNVTQVDSRGRDDEAEIRKLLWGQRVEKIMYWKSPQANVGLSLTLISYGDTVQLGVMADAVLAPHYTSIVSSFPIHVSKLAKAAGAESPSSAAF